MTSLDIALPRGWRLTSRWYAVSTMPAAEERARASLLRAGFGVYLPKSRQERQHHRTKAWLTRERLLMPGYIFVEFPDPIAAEWVSRDERLTWLRLRSCDGVARALGSYDDEGEGRPFPVPAELVEALMGAQLNMEFDDTREARRRYEQAIVDRYPVGAKALITDGPFATFAGEIASVDGKGVLELLVSLMGRMVPVQLETGQIEVLKAA